MNSASATTITVNTSIFGASDKVEILNIGAGVCTITAGTCTVGTSGSLALSQNAGGTLTFISASASVFTASAISSALVLVKSQVIGTTVSSVAVTSVFSTTYDTYKVVINGGVGSTNQDLGVTLGSTATGYYYSYNTATYAGATSGGGIANGSSFGNLGVFNTNVITMNFDIQNPFNAEETLISASRIDPTTTGSTGNVRGYLNNATSYTDFTLTPGAGTITGGTIYVYGYAKA
jgi:hypothetical protein